MADLTDRPPPEPEDGDWLTAHRRLGTPPPRGQDPVAIVAVGLGLLGIVFFGIVLAVVTAILGAQAGQRARESGRSFELPYLAFLLAFVDGVVWLAMHYLFKVPIWIG
ncbi:MAG: hypothetical protein ABI345_05115 [Jatrophihabitans sp.]